MSENKSNTGNLDIVTRLARGINLASKGNADNRKGSAIAVVSMLQLLADAKNSGDELLYTDLCRHVAGVHSNAKEQPEAFKASWAFWQNIFNVLSEKERPDFEQLTAEDEEDLSDRRMENDNVRSSIRALRFACSVAYAFTQSHMDWTVKEHIKFPGGQVVGISQVLALALFGSKKEKAITKLVLGVVIDTYGQWNFKALAEIGNAKLVVAGVRKAARKAEAKAVPVRDVADGARKVIESADTKALDKDTRLRLHELLVTIIDRLNDVDLGDAYIPTATTSAVRDAADKFISKTAKDKEANIAALSAAIKKSVAA